MSERATRESPQELGARVLAARGRSVLDAPAETPEVTRRPMRWTVVLIALLATGVFVFALRGSAPGASAGRLEATERTTQPLARRGVAVLEAGAAIEWAIDSSGALIFQRSGDVFYRAQRGAPFRVETPVARIDVTGASLRVRIDGRSSSVRVEEGTIEITDLDGAVRIGAAGDIVTITSGRLTPRPD